MRFQFFPLIAIGFIFSACGSSKKVAEADTNIKGSFAANITVDGKMDDWKNIPTDSNSKGSIEYAIANNATDLFIVFKIADEAEQMKLLGGGMEIWFDANNKHEKTTEIIYPVKGELGDLTLQPKFSLQGEKMNKSEIHRRITGQLISFNRAGFKPEYNGVQSVRENTGFKGAIGWNDNDDLIYEVQIPFAAFTNDVKRNNLQIGFSLNGVDRPKETANNGGEGGNTNWNAGGGGGGRGGMRGGGGGGRGGYGRGGGRGSSQSA